MTGPTVAFAIGVFLAAGSISGLALAQGTTPDSKPLATSAPPDPGASKSATSTPPDPGAPPVTAPAPAAAAPAGDPVAGLQKTQMCAGCHGIEGWRTAFPEVYKVPRIAGQHEAYLVKALHAYKSGERNHPSMRAIAASLSDKDMADLAAYYARPPVRAAAK